MPPFTVTQAQALIPLLQKEMAALLPSYQALKSVWAQTAKSMGLEIDSSEVREQCMQDLRVVRALRQIEASLSFFEELGVECRGIEDGIFEFPCLMLDRLVLLSWKLDDEAVSHWHELDVAYAERRPLMDLGESFNVAADLEKRVVN